MLNHTYTSVKNANLVDCGKKQHIPSQPIPLLKENFLKEFRTELDKKKVLTNLGIATDLVLEWGNIKGDIGDNINLIQELDARTTYTSQIENFKGKVITLIEGIKYLETVVGNEQGVENEQNTRLENLEKASEALAKDLETINTTLTESVKVDIEELKKNLDTITKSVENITELIQVSSKSDNALQLISGEETPGLYVPDLSGALNETSDNVKKLDGRITDVENSLGDFVTKEDLGGEGDYNFVKQTEFDSYTKITNSEFTNIKTDLQNTVKTGEDGHVDTLYVNTISKNNDEGNIKITDSFEVESGIPLDVRFVRETIDDLLALPVEICHEGMGVIVNSLSSLYILRKPEAGTVFNQDYVSNINNWKCPEDLVTVALSKEDYDNLPEINPNVFYYIYEEEFTLTRPPRREEYESDQDFEDAQLKWKDQVIQLDQQYVSASWGIEIEELLSKKASNESVNLLKQEINAIKGDGEGPSLGNLGNSITELQEKSENLETLIETNSEQLDSVKTSVTGIEKSLESYVTKEELQDETQEFIFVKTSTYESDKSTFTEQLATKVETKEVSTENLKTTDLDTTNLNLNNTEIEIVDNRLSVGGTLVANSDDLLKVEVLTQSDYNNKESKGEIDEEVYYYTYEDENPMATKEDLQKALDRISALETDLMLLTKQVAILEEQIKSSTPSE